MDEQQMNLAVFTTMYVMKHNEPILHVFHHEEDGAWEFIGETGALKESEYMVVSLKNMLDADSSLWKLLDLSLGELAQRPSADAPWERYRI